MLFEEILPELVKLLALSSLLVLANLLNEIEPEFVTEFSVTLFAKVKLVLAKIVPELVKKSVMLKLSAWLIEAKVALELLVIELALIVKSLFERMLFELMNDAAEKFAELITEIAPEFVIDEDDPVDVRVKLFPE